MTNRLVSRRSSPVIAAALTADGVLSLAVLDMLHFAINRKAKGSNMIRKVLLAVTAGVLVSAPATASADVAVSVADKPAAAQEVAISTGSGVADTVINGLIAVIFGPNDPSTCKFPYCF
ncbi:hypothetical protein [Nocardia nepalensis]|uniref:hypothetical protein n=1 Tax=Nocardia nepalensis TaxID=3375448 RepID=UPI003B67EF66